MPLTIELETETPDLEVFAIRGLPEVGSEILAAVQRRADGRYLTLHGQWDETPSWHPCARVAADDGNGESRFAAQTELVAGIRAAAGESLDLHVRRGGYSDLAPLIVRGPVGAPTGRAGPAPATGPDAAVAPGWGESDLMWTQPMRPAAVQDDADPDGEPSRSVPGRPVSRKGRWLSLWPVALGVLGLLAGVAVWIDSSGPTPLQPGPTPSETAPTATQPAAGTAPDRREPATGKTLYLELKGQNLAPEAIFEHAESADRAGDCEAAIRLFMDSARRDPQLAERLGRRYDPDGFEPSACFPEAKPDSAATWYQSAAERDIPSAQRRYGELLLQEADSGPIYREAIDWLRRAADAGDPSAARRLDTLEP